MTLMAFLAGENRLLLIAAAVIFVCILGWLSRSSFRLMLTASASAMNLYKSITVTAALQKKGWKLGAWKTVPGNFTLHFSPGGIFNATPQATVTTLSSPAAIITVTSTSAGVDSLRITATTLNATAAANAKLPIRVAP